MRILLTGGNGTFGRAVIPRLERHAIWSPGHKDLDICEPESWHRAVMAFQPDVIVHAAAYTAVDKAEVERDRCYCVNFLGTRLGLAEAAEGRIRFLYISTEYVFDGEKEGGLYDVKDRLGPVNYYAQTKTWAELLVQEYGEGAILRTSFAPDGPWRHERAFADQWTSKDYISTLAPAYARAIETPFTGIVHIGSERKTVLELARRTRPDVQPIRREDMPMRLPKDTSLDTSSWEFVNRCWSRLSRSLS